jgi:hypothetical protein
VEGIAGLGLGISVEPRIKCQLVSSWGKSNSIVGDAMSCGISRTLVTCDCE